MGVRSAARRRLARWAARRPHVLLVTAPGGTGARLAVEAQVRTRGGVLTGVPADADVLVVAGSPGSELADAADLLWSQLPAPRIRVDVPDAAGAAAVLSEAIRRLAGTPDAGAGADVTEQVEPMSGHAHEHDGHGGHEDEAHEHGGMQMPSGHDHEGHGGHDDGGMQMPGGLMMADRAPDRDGLKLDVLHVALGPVLPAWPSGLVMDVELQGDVVQSAAARVSAGSGGSASCWTGEAAAGRRRAAAHLDSVGRLLEVAGWSGAADRARRLRDTLLTASAAVSGDAPAEVDRLHRRVEHSWGLRRSLAGLGRLGPGDVGRFGLSGPAARAAEDGGDAWARLRTWLAEAELALAGRPVTPGEGPRGIPGHGSDALVAAAAHLLPGLGLADARLVVASLDPDPDELHATPAAGDQEPHPGHEGPADHNMHGMHHQHDGDPA